jgi:flavin reductase (DIM6/NTAB) family NADH-FMN oxidoreductase RutF
VNANAPEPDRSAGNEAGSLDASQLDADAKRTALRMFTYGLYVVTSVHEGDRGAFTANWLSQVSFDQPLVMVSVERDSHSLPQPFLVIANVILRAARR